MPAPLSGRKPGFSPNEELKQQIFEQFFKGEKTPTEIARDNNTHVSRISQILDQKLDERRNRSISI